MHDGPHYIYPDLTLLEQQSRSHRIRFFAAMSTFFVLAIFLGAQIFLTYFSNYVEFNFPDIFGSEELTQIMTQRARTFGIDFQTFQTFGISGKNMSPIRNDLNLFRTAF